MLSASGVRSALTVATTMTSCLTAVNVCFAVAIAVSLLRNAHEWIDHCDDDTDVSAESWCCWWWTVPAETVEVIEDAGPSRQSVESPPPPPSQPPLLEWIDVITHAKALCFRALLITPSMRPAEELGAVLQRLTVSHTEALRRNHLLTVRTHRITY